MNRCKFRIKVENGNVVEFNSEEEAYEFIAKHKNEYNWGQNAPEVIKINVDSYVDNILKDNAKDMYEAKERIKKKKDSFASDDSFESVEEGFIGVSELITIPLEVDSNGIKKYLAPEFIEENWINERYRELFVDLFFQKEANGYVYGNELLRFTGATNIDDAIKIVKNELFSTLINHDNYNNQFESAKIKLASSGFSNILISRGFDIENVKNTIILQTHKNFESQLFGEFLHNISYNVFKLNKSLDDLKSQEGKSAIMKYMQDRYIKEYSEYPLEFRNIANNFISNMFYGENPIADYDSFIDQFFLLKKEIYNMYAGADGKLRSSVKFHIETNISTRLNTSVNGKDKLQGKIDILVVEGEKLRLYEIKISNKKYDNWNSAKKLTANYQLGFYGRILNNLGINTSNLEYHVANFILSDSKKIKYEGIINLTQNVSGEYGAFIQDNLDRYIPRMVFSIYSDPADFEHINKALSIILPEDKYSKIDLDLIKENQVVKKDDGTFVFTYPNFGSKKNQNVILQNEREVDAFLNDYVDYIKEHKSSHVKRVLENVKNIISGTSPEDVLYYKASPKSKLYYKLLFAKYYNEAKENNSNEGRYQIIENENLIDLGVILIIDNVDHVVDIISVEGSDLSANMYSGKKKLPYLFDMFVKTNTKEYASIEQKFAQNGMKVLDASRGNFALLKALIILNEYKPLQNFKIGEVKAINTFNDQSISFNHDQIKFIEAILNEYLDNSEYKFNPNLSKHSDGIYKNIKRFDDFSNSVIKKIKGLFQLNSSSKHFKNLLNNSEIFSNFERYENATEKARSLFELANEIAVEGKINKSNPDITNPYTPIYSYVYMLALYYSNINLIDEQPPSLYFGPNILQMLDSLMINSLDTIPSENIVQFRNLISTANANTRDLYLKWNQKSRKENEKYEKAIGYSDFRDKLIGDKGAIHRNLFQENEFDLLLKNPYDNSNDLNDDEREYAKWILSTWTSHKGAEITKDDLKVPLVKSKFESQISNKTLTAEQIIKNVSYEWDSFIKDTFEERRVLQDSAAEGFEDIVFEFSDRTDDSKRAELINKYGIKAFETNLEIVSAMYYLAKVRTENNNKVMPYIRGIQAIYALKGAVTGTDFSKMMEFVFESAKNIVYQESLVPEEMRGVYKVISFLREFASVTALSWNFTNLPREILMGFWVNIESAMLHRYGKNSFGLKDYKNALKYLFYDAPKFISEVTKIELLNELYAMANMDIDNLVGNTTSYKNGIVGGFSRYSSWALTAPDYWNRMSIFLAQLIHDGAWKAHYVEKDKDGIERLVYNCELDERYNVYFKYKNKSIPSNELTKYKKQEGLYLANLKQFNKERQLLGLDLLKVGDKLPSAYTNLERDSIKSFADMSFGYYDRETKSHWNRLWQGAVLKQFMTYLTAKKTQYMLRRTTIPSQGHFVPVVNKNGEQVYTKTIIDKNGYFIESEITTEDTGVPLIMWEGRIMEGIFQTYFGLIKDLYNFTKNQITNNDGITGKDLSNKYLFGDTIEAQNIKAGIYDLFIFSFLAQLLFMAVLDLPEDEKSYTAQIKDLNWFMRFGLDVFQRSTDDIGFINAVQSGLLNWNPPAISIAQSAIRSFSSAFKIEDINLAEAMLLGVTNSVGMFRPVRQDIKQAIVG